MDDRFLTAFLSLERHKVAGHTLRPFSLRHRLTLEAIESPLLPGSPNAGKATPTDLILAARVCSMPDAFEAVRRSRWLDRFWLVRMTLNPSRYMEQLGRWRGYILDTAQHPIIASKTEKEGRRDSGVHWMLSVVCGLKRLGFTEEEAWTMPEGRALFYFYADAIRDGAEVRVVTTEAEAKLPAARAAVEAAVAKAKAAAEAKAGKGGKR